MLSHFVSVRVNLINNPIALAVMGCSHGTFSPLHVSQDTLNPWKDIYDFSICFRIFVRLTSPTLVTQPITGNSNEGVP